MNIRRSLAARIFRPGGGLTESAELIHHTDPGVPNGRDADGEHVAGPTITTAIEVVSSPLTGEQRLNLPEALRSTELRNFIVRVPIRGIDSETGQDADLIRYHGNLFRVVRLEAWGGDFSEVVGQRPTRIVL